MKQSVVIFLFIHFSFLALAEGVDSIPASNDSLKIKKGAVAADTSYIRKRANKATLYSAIIPGLGQAYNKKYWKIPIIYGGFYALIRAIQFNNEQYHIFDEAYIQRVNKDTDAYFYIYTDPNSLVVRRDYYRRSRDLMYIFAGALYVLNIIDAYVDAHLVNFDVSDNLSLRVSPTTQMIGRTQPVASLSFSLGFR